MRSETLTRGDDVKKLWSLVYDFSLVLSKDITCELTCEKATNVAFKMYKKGSKLCA